MQNISLAFHVGCLIATTSMLIFGGCKYFQNESTSLVNYPKYHDAEKDTYPSFSLCFKGENIYKKDELNQKYGVDDVKKYVAFLKGLVWDDRMLKINYDDLTMDLKDHVTSIEVLSHTGIKLFSWKTIKQGSGNSSEKEEEPENTFPFYINYRNSETKCFSLDLHKDSLAGITGKIINYVSIRFENIRLPGVSMAYYLHYPKQLMRSSGLDHEFPGNPGITIGDIGLKTFMVGDLDVIRRRNTRQSSCYKDRKRDDDFILTKIIKTVQCIPPHWKNTYLGYERCNDTRKMKDAYIPELRSSAMADEAFLSRFVQPCDQIQSVSLNIKEVLQNISNQTQQTPADVMLIFKSAYYKEIQHVQAFCLESLIGNMGGYIGLFLGCAIWQLPDAIQITIQKLTNCKLSVYF